MIGENNTNIMVGVLGLGLIQIVTLYEQTGPSLQDLRNADPGNDLARQHLQDTNILVGTVVAVVAIVASVVSRSVIPLIMFLGGFFAVAYWHSMVLYGKEIP